MTNRLYTLFPRAIPNNNNQQISENAPYTIQQFQAEKRQTKRKTAALLLRELTLQKTEIHDCFGLYYEKKERTSKWCKQIQSLKIERKESRHQ